MRAFYLLEVLHIKKGLVEIPTGIHLLIVNEKKNSLSQNCLIVSFNTVQLIENFICLSLFKM